MNRITLLGPGVPARGMRSAPDPTTLPPGIWSRLENVRCDGGTFRVRDGSVRIVSSGPLGGSFRGMASITFEGSPFLVAAFRVGDRTRVYRLAGSTWHEITTSLTRLPTDGEVNFAVVHDGGAGPLASPADVLIIANGMDSPRVVVGSNLTLVSIQQPIPAPAWANQSATPQGWMALTSNVRALASQPFQFSAAAPGGGVGPTLTIEPSVTSAATVTLTFGTQQILGAGASVTGLPVAKEVCLATTGNPWPRIRRLELLLDRPGTSAMTVLSATGTSPVVITTAAAHGLATGDWVRVQGVGGNPGANGAFAITVLSSTTFSLDGSTSTTASTSPGTAQALEWSTAFDLGTAADVLTLVDLEPGATMAAVLAGAHEGRTGWSGLRITASETPPSAAQSFELLAVASSGALDGRSRFALGYYSSESRAEGASVSADTAQGITLSAIGGTSTGAKYRWTPDSDFRTAWVLGVADPAGLAGSPNYALVYRSDPGQTDDDRIAYGPFALSAWTSLTGSPLGFVNCIVTSQASDITRFAKEDGHSCLPVGSILCAVNDRLWVAGTAQPSALWVSGDRDPFAFRQVPNLDDDGQIEATSPTYRTFAGEQIRAILPLLGDVLGVDSVLLWTDRAVYRMGGFDAREVGRAARIDDRGLFRGPAATLGEGATWFLDGEGQVRRSGAGLASTSISRERVGNLLAAADLSGSLAIFFRGRFRLFFRESLESAESMCLLWDESAGEWGLDRLPFLVAGCALHSIEGPRKLYACTPTGELWELESAEATEDGDDPILVRLAAAEVGPDGFSPATFGRIGLVTDGPLTGSLATRRTCPFDGSVTEGTLDLSGGAWRFDVSPDGGAPGTGVVPTCIPEISGALLGGTRIRTIVLDYARRQGGADRA